MIGLKEGVWLVQVNWIEATRRVRKAELYNKADVVTKTYSIYYVIKFRADAFGWHSVLIKFKLKLRVTTTSAKTSDHNHNTIVEQEDEKNMNLEPYREKQEVWHEIPGGQFSISNSDGFLEFGMFEVDNV